MPSATVVILVKNAESNIKETLDAVFTQETGIEFEVLIIDSGSKDRTLEIVRSYPVRVIQIEPEEFNHGETRNLGGRQAHPDSKFMVYLTQDAKPHNNFWLQNLLMPFDEGSDIAGVFSRHIPRPTASVSTVRQLTTLSQTGGLQKLVKKIPASSEEYERDKFWYIYFSNTSSAIRRETWEKIPFDRVDFAEDAVWADKVIRAGHTLVFEPSSMVMHSHDYNMIEQFRQNVDHAHAMYKLFRPASFEDNRLWLKLFLGMPVQVWSDWKYMRDSEYFREKSNRFKFSTMVNSPFWQIATIAGSWVGAHLDHMPRSLKFTFSRQERIRQSK